MIKLKNGKQVTGIVKDIYKTDYDKEKDLLFVYWESYLYTDPKESIKIDGGITLVLDPITNLMIAFYVDNLKTRIKDKKVGFVPFFNLANIPETGFIDAKKLDNINEEWEIRGLENEKLEYHYDYENDILYIDTENFGNTKYPRHIHVNSIDLFLNDETHYIIQIQIIDYAYKLKERKLKPVSFFEYSQIPPLEKMIEEEKLKMKLKLKGIR